jgi:hypothetical protein
MSLQITHTLRGGIVVTDAVHKINQLIWKGGGLHIELGVYKDVTASQDGSLPADYVSVLWPAYDKAKASDDTGAAADNAHAQAYAYLKTLDAYDGATDV